MMAQQLKSQASSSCGKPRFCRPSDLWNCSAVAIVCVYARADPFSNVGAHGNVLHPLDMHAHPCCDLATAGTLEYWR